MSHSNESRHIRMSHVTFEWVTSHSNESRSSGTWICHMSHSYVTFHEYVIMNKSYVSFVDESCHIWICHMSHSHVTFEWVTSHSNESRSRGTVTYHFTEGRHNQERVYYSNEKIWKETHYADSLLYVTYEWITLQRAAITKKQSTIQISPDWWSILWGLHV